MDVALHRKASDGNRLMSRHVAVKWSNHAPTNMLSQATIHNRLFSYSYQALPDSLKQHAIYTCHVDYARSPKNGAYMHILFLLVPKYQREGTGKPTFLPCCLMEHSYWDH
jgi:hypothetical protein